MLTVMKKYSLFSAFIAIVAMLVGCGSNDLGEGSALEFISETPVTIAVICDFTASQEQVNEKIGPRLASILDPIFDSLLPKSSQIAFFPMSDKPESPFFRVEYRWKSDEKKVKQQYPAIARKWNTALDSAINSRATGEANYVNQARSCIDISIDNAANFIGEYESSGRRMVIISDLVEQCSYSLITNSPAHFIGTPSRKFGLDDFSAAVNQWEPEKKKLRDMDVVVIPTATSNSAQAPQVKIQEVWTRAINKFGAAKDRIHVSTVLPTWLTSCQFLR